MKLSNNGHRDAAPLEPIAEDPRAPRDHIALRWHIDPANELRLGWPEPGTQGEALAIGWVAEDRPIGVIEAPAAGLDEHQLDTLDARFPGRRWFAGRWDVPFRSRAAA